MWILEEIVSLLGSYSVEDLLPTAKCVAPTLFCGPCTDTKINIDQRTCSNIYEQSGNSCLHWLGESLQITPWSQCKADGPPLVNDLPLL